MEEVRIPTPEPITRVEKVNKYKLNKVETRDMKETKLPGEGMQIGSMNLKMLSMRE